MPRPTIKELIDRSSGELESGLEFLGPVLQVSVAYVLARVIAGAAHMMHGRVSYAGDQIFPDKADRENLIRDASRYDVRPNAAGYWSGKATGTGIDGAQVGREASLFSESGKEYLTTEEATVSNGVITLFLEAVEAGSMSNLVAGSILSLESPIPSVEPTFAVMSDALVDGVEEEETEEFRVRFIESLATEDNGGSDDDYIRWAKEVPGVTRVWVNRHENGLGTLTVRFVRDKDVSIFPGPGEVDAVRSKLLSERPATAELYVSAPIEQPVNFEITLAGNTANTQLLVIAQLKDLFFRRAVPGKRTGEGTVLLSEIRTAIGNASPGYVLNSPTVDQVPSLGQLLTVGSFTFNG